MKTYTWKQIEEALISASIDPSKVYSTLAESSYDMTQALEGPDPAGQEPLEPRAPAEKDWANRHTVQVFDRPDAERQDNVDEIEQSSMPVAPTSAAKPETNVSFARIRQMMSS